MDRCRSCGLYVIWYQPSHSVSVGGRLVQVKRFGRWMEVGPDGRLRWHDCEPATRPVTDRGDAPADYVPAPVPAAAASVGPIRRIRTTLANSANRPAERPQQSPTGPEPSLTETLRL